VRLRRQWLGRALALAIELAGLVGLVALVYLAIVLGLGRVPSDGERTLLLFSGLAAVVAALLYRPASRRISDFAERTVRGERRAPEEVLLTFGDRLTRAVPMDELLLQLAESLRTNLGLESAEVWTGSDGSFELLASDPDRGSGRISLTSEELPVVAGAGVSGNAWVEVWLPEFLSGRKDSAIRLAPITYGGELLGMIVSERAPGAEPFDDDDDQALAELTRRVGVALRNVRLDSALQASLDELRRHADELRASRTRIVAATDAERRRIERDLHDGAQQRLVSLAVKLRLVEQLSDSDPAGAKRMLEDLSASLDAAIQELREFAHGIYPPLLMDRGLGEALSAAAARASLPTRVDAGGIGRYPQDIEAAVYFCCLEALQNAGKYAGDGASVTVQMGEEEGGLMFAVTDDGRGFDSEVRRGGTGFINMNDRLGAIGGALRVESTPGAGTKVSGVVPLPR
jgi:signal transduction histidine kinase